MNIQSFFDKDTFTFSYVVTDTETRACAVIDPVLDIDMASGKVSTTSADALIDYIRAEKLSLEWILETHVHADHLTASQYLKRELGGQVGIGSKVGVVQETFGPMFNVEPEFATDGSQFDRLFDNNDSFKVGSLEFQVLHTPGHTPACAVYVTEGAAFVGDTLFMPDYGTARTDFPGGDAATLYDSIQKILSLPAETVLYMCHDYLTEARTEYVCETTVAEELNSNIHLAGHSKAEFVKAREARDAKLAAPRLLLPSIQVNMRAGALPPAEDNEMRYLKIPLRTA
ncbi:MAG: MBL fold metallo-hydrolase [Pseudomonadales bacterium]|jgi:glyoxylase-like metal-dependent hydrolase (beta-lactamase superfamily II)|nr:MBL fold metallo-hydrolase [Pseudomonadales bacterium]